ncbi:MAG: response regulator [Anaerolineaceae bacterium]|nr:response regulator [Anaerolineaceae bacterium]
MRNHLLVIDDEPSIGHLIALIGQKTGLTVTHATEGLEGIHLARLEGPDVILVDLFLWGKMDGWETIERIKQDKALQHIPVIAITSVGDLDHAYEMGCDGAILKPFTPARFSSYLSRFLEVAPVA